MKNRYTKKRNAGWTVLMALTLMPALATGTAAATEAVGTPATAGGGAGIADPLQLTLIAAFTPIAVFAVKQLFPKLPVAWLPVLAPLFGVAFDYSASLASGTANPWVAAVAGLAGVGFRELKESAASALGAKGGMAVVAVLGAGMCGGCALTPEAKLAITNAASAGVHLGLDALAASKPELKPICDQLVAAADATAEGVRRDVTNATAADVSAAVAKQVAKDIAAKVPKEKRRDVAAAVARGLRKKRDEIRSGKADVAAEAALERAAAEIDAQP
jgi:hypothetical protein